MFVGYSKGTSKYPKIILIDQIGEVIECTTISIKISTKLTNYIK